MPFIIDKVLDVLPGVSQNTDAPVCEKSPENQGSPGLCCVPGMGDNKAVKSPLRARQPEAPAKSKVSAVRRNLKDGMAAYL
jgi:hypothetical protein